MKGWVYVISNPGMAGLVKIGYTGQDPRLRALELDTTGSPHPYRLDYEMHIDFPETIERTAHRLMAHVRERTNREWFRCSAEEAIVAIRQAAERAFVEQANNVIYEVFHYANRAHADTISKTQRDRALREKLMADILAKQEDTMRRHYTQALSTQFPEKPFWPYWLGSSLALGIVMGIFIEKTTVGQLIFPAIIVGALVAFFVQSYLNDETKKSSAYQALLKERDVALAKAAEEIVFTCTACSRQHRTETKLVLDGGRTWMCPQLKVPIHPLGPQFLKATAMPMITAES